MDYAISKKITKAEFLNNMEGKFLKQIVKKFDEFKILPDAKSIYTVDLIRSVDRAASVAGEQRDRYARMFTTMLLSEIHKHRGTQEIIHKTPHTIAWAGYLQWMFPDSKFIHIIRDPRDICASVVPLKWGPKRVKDFPPYYLDLMKRAWEHRLNVPEDRYMVVSLESLVNNTTAVLHKIYRFIDYGRPDTALGQKVAAPIRADKAHVGRYRKDLSPAQAKFVDNKCWMTYQQWLNEAV